LLAWVPEDHLVWTVLDAVAEMDLGAFSAAYRADGHGRPAYEPAMMVALLLYAYARGNSSSRGIERACVEDVAYRVICSNLVRSLDDRGVSGAPRGGAGRAVHRCARALPAGGAGVGRG
jgi:transposase